MRTITTFFAVIALFTAAVGHPVVQAQDGNTGASGKSNIIYLADLEPSAINERLPSKNYLSRCLKVGECTLRGQRFARSVSVGPDSCKPSIVFLTGGKYDFFETTMGIDDHYPADRHKIAFKIIGDDKELYKSGNQPDITVGSQPIHIRISIKDVGRSKLYADCIDDFHAGDIWWGNARLIKGNAPPQPIGTSNGSGDKEPTTGSQESGTKVLRLDPEKLKELATDLKAEVADDPELKSRPTLAIAAFKLIPADALAPSNADNVREDLSTALIKTKAFDIVERGQLDQALKELKIGLKDTFDSAIAQKLGKLVGARVVLIGSISDRGTYTIINVRLIDTQTGRVRIASQVELRQ